LKDGGVRDEFPLNAGACFAGLTAMVDVLDGLLEADGDEQAEDDGGDVNEELAPGRGGVMGGVDVEHGGGLLRSLGCRSEGIGFGRDGSFLGHGGVGESVSRAVIS
jgi:hypothetical protein